MNIILSAHLYNKFPRRFGEIIEKCYINQKKKTTKQITFYTKVNFT